MDNKFRVFLFTAILLLFSAPAFTQTLSDAAAERLQAAEASASQALATYAVQYPDRPLWQETFEAVEEAISLAPSSPEPYRFQAIAHTMANWFGPAWEMWQAYLDRGFVLDAEAATYFVEAGQRSAYSLYEQGEREAALDIYLGVIDEVPFDLESVAWAGRILLELGRPEQAIPYWTTVTERNPTDERAAYFRELARDQARWGVNAANAFREGVSFYESGNMGEARERFARATLRNEAYAEAWVWLGRVEVELGNYADARTHYGRAMDIEPGFETYRYFYEEAGRRHE